jgi:hypothetical protein
MKPHTVYIKLSGRTASAQRYLNRHLAKVNNHLPGQIQVAQLRHCQSYVYADLHTSWEPDRRDEAYVQGLLAGILLGCSYEVL